jgi:zinc transport system ATP-binding protein
MEEACGLHCTKIENITVKRDNQVILKDVTFDVHCGELTMIIGRNGAGKSTLLKALLNEIDHTGKVEFLDMKENKKRKIKIGYVPQSLNVERDMPTTVYDMFASYISNKPVWFKKDKKTEEKIKENLKIFGAEQLIDKKVGNLSGGELQRILLAIATTPIPNLLILDEPVSGIDRNGTRDFYQILSELKEKYDMSIILVSHDLDLVKKFADKVILLDKQIIKEGNAEEVFLSEEFKERFGEI